MVRAGEGFVESEVFFDTTCAHSDSGDGDMDAESVVAEADVGLETLAHGLHGAEVNGAGIGGVVADAVEELEIGVSGRTYHFNRLVDFFEVCHSGAEDDRFLFEGDVANEWMVGEFAGRNFERGHADSFEFVGGVFIERG